MEESTYNPETDPNAAPSFESELAARERQQSCWEPDYCVLFRETANTASAIDRSVPC